VRFDPTFIVASVAGADPTGGAGIQGDLKTFSAHGVQGTAVVTAVTVQNHTGVRAIHPVPPDFVAAQLEALFDQLVPRALKTGMLHSAETVTAVVSVLSRRPVPSLVVDPVFSASAGGALGSDSVPRVLSMLLLPLATLVTPNLDEAGRMLRRTVAEGDVAEAAAELYRRLHGPAVLVKGGHGTGPESVDALATSHGVVRISAPRVPTTDGHGSGCALSAAITARLALGDRLEDAVRSAKAYVHRALAAARPLGVGRGPVAHAVDAT